MKRKIYKPVLCVLVCVMLFCACAKKEITGKDPVQVRQAAGSTIYSVKVYEDIPKDHNLQTIVVATSATPGECTYKESGSVLTGVGPATVDLRTTGALMDFQVEEVLKGDQELTGQKITIYEKLFHDENGELNEPKCVSVDDQKVVLCLHTGSDGLYYIHIPEYFLIPIKKNDTLDIWPYLNRTQEKVTLDDFREMCAAVEEN